MNNDDICALEQKLNECKNLSFKDVDIDKVIDLSEIKISQKKLSSDRVIDFIKKVDNPYFFKSGKTLIKIGFCNNGKTADQCITNVIKSIYK